MAVSIKSKRVVFIIGKQYSFLLQAKKKLNVSDHQLARLLNISTRTLTDWKREKFSLPLVAVKILQDKLGLKLPLGTEIREPYWYVHKAAKAGGLATHKKHGQIGGDPQYRKDQWYRWWKQIGKIKHHPILDAKPFRKPRMSRDLAELAGIILGDGGLSQYQLTVTLHFKDDANYCQYVTKLIERLFNTRPSIYLDRSDSVNRITVSRKGIVDFFLNNLDLKIGSKIRQQISIPTWVYRKKSWEIACIRGLIDTDGCVVIHRYRSKNKIYTYRKLCFTSLSKPMISDVYRILNNLGFRPRIALGKEVWLDSQAQVKNYFKVIGSNNLKHLTRYGGKGYNNTEVGEVA